MCVGVHLTCGKCSRRWPNLSGASWLLWRHSPASVGIPTAIVTDVIADRKQNSPLLPFPVSSSRRRVGADTGLLLSNEAGWARYRAANRRHRPSVLLFPDLVIIQSIWINRSIPNNSVNVNYLMNSLSRGAWGANSSFDSISLPEFLTAYQYTVTITIE